jgi:Zn-finger nucleic acid-binding protein
VDEQARRCRYCAAPVATVRCATCFHMNVPEAGYCSGCGRQLGLEPVASLGGEGPLPCPICKTPLEAYRDGTGALFDCAQCGGQFVEHALLRAMLHEHEHAAFPEGAARLAGRPEPRNSYIPCPACAALMNRKNFGEVSGVIVDVCKKHGTWFDTGELPRVLAFVAAGGLERARKRAAEEEARSLRAAHVAAAAASIAVPTSSHDHTLAQRFVDLLLH